MVSISVLAIASAAFALLTQAQPLLLKRVAEPEDPCDSLYIVGARGSTQPKGFGKQVGSVIDEVRGIVEPVHSDPVAYPAKLVPYRWSMNKGVKDAKSKVRQWVEKCGEKSKIALVGYSQGAQVATNVLASPSTLNTKMINDAGLDPEHKQYIIATSVLADPTTSTKTKKVGAQGRRGIFARLKEGTQEINKQQVFNAAPPNDPVSARGSNFQAHTKDVNTFISPAAEHIAMVAWQHTRNGKANFKIDEKAAKKYESMNPALPNLDPERSEAKPEVPAAMQKKKGSTEGTTTPKLSSVHGRV